MTNPAVPGMIWEAVLFVALLCSACARPHPSAPAGSLSFLLVGDWGGQQTSPYYTKAQKDVAAAMGKTAQSLGSQFTVAVGDNFYDLGVKDHTDPRFKDTFEVRGVARSM